MQVICSIAGHYIPCSYILELLNSKNTTLLQFSLPEFFLLCHFDHHHIQIHEMYVKVKFRKIWTVN
jgi:hypothetical protein